MSKIIGKKVKVIIDRPLGSHHLKYHNTIYVVNYGYVEGVIANDGEYQDAYVIGPCIPLKVFIGTIIAIVHRKNDIEDKWVVAEKGKNYSKKQIEEYIQFQNDLHELLNDMEQFIKRYYEVNHIMKTKNKVRSQ